MEKSVEINIAFLISANWKNFDIVHQVKMQYETFYKKQGSVVFHMITLRNGTKNDDFAVDEIKKIAVFHDRFLEEEQHHGIVRKFMGLSKEIVYLYNSLGNIAEITL